MKIKNSLRWLRIGTLATIIFFVMACSPSSDLDPTLTPSASSPITPTPTSNESSPVTPTPTVANVVPEGTSPETSRCEGLSGELEMQVLIGPAEAVGLEPIAVGEIPFIVTVDGDAYLVQGYGNISYQETLEEDWGTYTVSFDMAGTLDGECSGEPGSEELNITVEMSGEQMVEVRAEGFQGDYPWNGTQELNLRFPLEEGAISEGEGWAFILHLSQ